MNCPCCKTELVPWKMLRLETLDEHVSGCQDICEKQAYRCPTPGCPVNGMNVDANTPKIFWNEIGDMHSNLDTSSNEAFKREKEYLNGMPWIDKNDAPFGTFQRQMNVEIRKHDEDKDLFILPKWLPFCKGWKCERVWHYKSNEDGDILKRSSSLRWWIPGNLPFKGYTLYVSGFRMLRHVLREVWRNYVDLLQAKNENQAKWTINQLKEIIKRKEYKDAEWWRYCGAFAAQCVLGLHNLAEG